MGTNRTIYLRFLTIAACFPLLGAAAIRNFHPKLSFEPLSRTGYLARAARYSVAVESDGVRFSETGGRPLFLRFPGAKARVTGTPGVTAKGRMNYYTGNQPAQWRTGVSLFESVEYQNVYPGVDLVYHAGTDEAVEYDFRVAPGADPSQIGLAFDGPVHAASDGAVVSSNGATLQRAPIAYQTIDGARRAVSVKLVDRGKNRMAFELGDYDRRQALVIDPVLVFSTYLGGSGEERGEGVAVDGQGNIYVTGSTSSTNFPVKPNVGNHGYKDVFVTKFDPSGNLLFSTLIGGSDYDSAYRIKLDSMGNILLAGGTTSTNFPTYPGNVFQTRSANGHNQGFVVKLAPDGTFIASTLLSGFQESDSSCYVLTAIYGLDSDAAGNIYVAGETCAKDFPLKSPIVSQIAGTDACFVAEFNPQLTGLVYSTYLSNASDEWCNAIAVDGAGNAYVAGGTISVGVATPGAFQTQFGGGSDYGDGIVAKISANGASKVFYTYLGGTLDDALYDITVDSAGNPWVTGWTESMNFPMKNPLQGTYGGGPHGATMPCGCRGGDVLVTELNQTGSALLYSTYLGGSGLEDGENIHIEPNGDIYVTGSTTTTSGLATPDAAQKTLAGLQDVFVAVLSAGGSSMKYFTYLGGASVDEGRAIAVASGNIYTAGTTQSPDFPMAHPFQSKLSGSSDAFVSVIGTPVAPGPVIKAVTNGASFAPAPAVSPGSLATIFGTTLVPQPASASSTPLPVSLGNLSVKINSVAVPLLFVNSTQINFQVPNGLQPGEAEAVIEVNGQVSTPYQFLVSTAAPGVFTYGQNQAVAQNYPSGVINSPTAPISAGGVITVYMTGIGPVDNQVTDGAPAKANPLSQATSSFSATINGVNAPVSFLGLAPGFVGLGQANVTVPTGLTAGSYPLVLTVKGQLSNGPLVSVK